MDEKQLADLITKTVDEKVAEVKTQQMADREVAEKRYAELHGGIAIHGAEKIKTQKEVPEEIKLGRMVKALALAGGNAEKAAWVMGNQFKDFPGAEELKGVFEDSVNGKALNMTVPSEGGFNVPIAYSSRQIEVLYANTAVMKTPITKLPLNNGNLTVRRMDTAANISYFGESQKVPQTAQVFGDIKLTGKKLGAKVILTNDLLRSNDINTDAWVIRDLQRKFNLKIDSTMLYGAGTLYTPAGIDTLMASANKLGSTSTATTSDIPLQMVVALNSGNVPEESRVWIMHPQMWGYLSNYKATTGQFIFREEMARGTLFGYPIYQTTQSGYTNTGTYNTSSADIWLGSWQEMIWGDQMSMEIVTSKEASYFDTAANALVSAFDRDETVVRVIGVHDFNIMHDVSFVKFTGKFAAS